MKKSKGMPVKNKTDIQNRVVRTLNAAEQGIHGLSEIVTSTQFRNAITTLANRKGRILVSGVGKSGFIAMKMAATLVSLGHQASYLNPLDALHGDSGMVRDGDVLVLFSFSGGSVELIKLVKHFRKHFKIKVVTITGKKTSSLANISDTAVVFSLHEEGCPLGLAPMASTTASLVIADCIAAALTSPKEFKPEHFAKYHPAGTLGLTLTPVRDVMRAGKNIPKLPSDSSFEDALKTITKQKLVQIVGIVDTADRLIGAFSDGDIRRMLLRHGDLRGKLVRELMNESPHAIHHEETLHTALGIMRDQQVNSLFVVDTDARYIGFIHIHDILGDA